MDKEFAITERELKAIAAPAIIGSKRNPLKGYKIPKIKFREELTFHIIKELVKAEKILEHKIIPVF